MKKYWTEKTHDYEQLTSLQERERQLLKINTIYKYIANPSTIQDETTKSYIDFLKGKKVSADKVIFEKEKTLSAYKNADISIDEDLNDNEVLGQITQQVNYEAQLKSLKLFYNMYMSESYSDIKWRLGSIKGTVEDVDYNDDKFGLLLNGKNYTRSNMSLLYNKYYTKNGEMYRKQEVFSSFSFPPYKIGPNSEYGIPTSIMTKVLSENPDATFDQDNFTIKREGFTFRDIGMKSLSDYINYLQWVIDGACGIVSTYLTEWDLSVYIQEGLMQPQVNGKPMRIYLNHRIYEDNPLSDAENEDYINDKALTFNVCGSAVSKLEGDNEKYWRPSDYPLSVWWTPYIEKKDWKVKRLSVNMFDEEVLDIPYMSIYDEASSTFDYRGSKSLQKIIQNQDYIGMAIATKPTERLHYYDAFYTNPDDGFTDFDIKFNNIIKKVAGAKAGWSTKKGLDLDYLLVTAKQEMLMNGGYFGGPQQVGNGGGYMNRMFIQSAMENGGDSTKMTMSKMMSKSRSSGNDNDGTSDLSQTDDLAKESLASTFDNSKDSSTMSKMTGINRLSSTLYGGPHGSSYSLYNLKSFYDDSIINRNIPRLGLEGFEDNFKSETNLFSGDDFVYKRDDDDLTNEKTFYEKDFTQKENLPTLGSSPSSVLYELKNGTFTNFKYEVADTYYETTEKIVGEVVFNETTRQYEAYLPEKDDLGNIINYTGPTEYTKKTYPKPKSFKEGLVNIWYRISKFSSTINVPVRTGTFKKKGKKIIKVYNFNSMPNAKWKIVQHSFEDFIPKEQDVTDLWNLIGSSKYKASFVKDCKDFIKEKRPCFMLKFDDKNDENYFIQKIIQFGRGEEHQDDGSTVWFFEGNKQYGESEIPSSVFRATCYVRYYRNVCEKWKKGIFGKEHLDGYSYTYIPFIYVDLINADRMLDNLDVKPQTNANISGENQPVHISSTYSMQTIVNASNPLEKFKNAYNDTIISFRRKHVSDAGMKTFWSAVAVVACIIVAPVTLLGVAL